MGNNNSYALISSNMILEYVIFGILLVVGCILIIRLIKSYDNKYEHLKQSFSDTLYRDYLQRAFSSDKRKALIYIYLHNESGDYEKDNIIKKLLNGVNNRYKGTKGLRVFRIENQSLAICINEHDLLEEVSTDLKGYLDEEQSKYSRFRKIVSTIVAVDDIHLLGTFDELEILLKNYCSQRSTSNIETTIIHFDESIISSVKEEIKISNEIDYIIENDGVKVLLQPIYSVKENKFVAAEAFMYIHDRNGNNMKPNTFIPVAIKYNKMKYLGACLIKKVCEFYENLSEKNIELDHIFINVSGNELEDPEYLNMIIEEVSKSRIDVDKIAIELNNIDSITHRDLFLNNLNSIRLFGLPIAISGFGGVDSRIDEIISLPVEIIKLDVNIINKANEDERASSIIKEILLLAQKINMQTIAVGVENEKQANHMVELGVNYIQGRYYSDSLTFNEFVYLIEKSKEDKQ